MTSVVTLISHIVRIFRFEAPYGGDVVYSALSPRAKISKTFSVEKLITPKTLEVNPEHSYQLSHLYFSHICIRCCKHPGSKRHSNLPCYV